MFLLTFVDLIHKQRRAADGGVMTEATFASIDEHGFVAQDGPSLEGKVPARR
jgi:hypothetical protein